MKLNDIQIAFCAALRSSENNEALCSIITSCGTLSSHERINIYRDSVNAVMIRALRQVYPVCNKLIGDENFSQVAARYCQQHPSHTPNLADYGAHFSNFIEGLSQLETVPYLSGIAALEWAWHRAFYGSNPLTLDFEKLKFAYDHSPEKICFSLYENSSLITSQFPLLTIWQMNQENTESDDILQISKGDRFFFVTRTQLQPQIIEIDRFDFELLELFQKKYPLDQLPEKFYERLPYFISKSWLSDFVIAGDANNEYSIADQTPVAVL